MVLYILEANDRPHANETNYFIIEVMKACRDQKLSGALTVPNID